MEEIRDSKSGSLIAIFIDFSKAFDSIRWTYIRAVLLAYNVPVKLVKLIMALYCGAKAKVKYSNDKFTDYISLSVGVLQGDTLAPYLFVIVLDYVLRMALENQKLGVRLSLPGGTRSRPAGLDTYLTDLDFADDIMLAAESATCAQEMLSSVAYWAGKVGLNVNLSKTEYMLVGNWPESPSIWLNSGLLKQVKDFKYLGSWLLDCTKDFEARKALAWTACIRLNKIWKSMTLSRDVKTNLFRACVESTLFYNAATWTMTKTLASKVDGAYTKLLRYALGYKWSDKVSNATLYGNMKRASEIIRKRRLRLAGHCYRSKDQPISQLLFWDHSIMSGAGCHRGGMKSNYAREMLKEVASLAEDVGLSVVDVTDVQNLMRDRDSWRNLTYYN
jgi:hypothetical protein